jgi:hypothetical protein
LISNFFIKLRDLIEVQGEYLVENTLKDIKLIDDEDFLKTLDLTATKKDLQTLHFIGNQIIVDYENIPL